MKQFFFNFFSSQKLFIGLLLVPFFSVVAQEVPKPQTAPIVLDSLYREDQFYLGISYNLLKNAPDGFSNDKFSAGFSAGFLRDMPLNTKRNLAIAPGIGFTFNNYSQNIGITNSEKVAVYTLLPNSDDYSRNKFALWFVDVPLELRWRGSTMENHNFWRVHLGLKMSYLLYDRSIYKAGGESIVLKNNTDFSKFHYGVYLVGGYGGVNLFANFGLNPLFKSAQIDGKNINMKTFNVGLIFYIL